MKVHFLSGHYWWLTNDRVGFLIGWWNFKESCMIRNFVRFKSRLTFTFLYCKCTQAFRTRFQFRPFILPICYRQIIFTVSKVVSLVIEWTFPFVTCFDGALWQGHSSILLLRRVDCSTFGGIWLQAFANWRNHQVRSNRVRRVFYNVSVPSRRSFSDNLSDAIRV